MSSYKKLVRDKIPDIIKARGAHPKTRILDEKEYVDELLKKLIEEAQELQDDPNIEERADVAEVLRALDEALGFSEQYIEKTRGNKASERGGFEDRVFLEDVQETDQATKS